MTQLGFFVDISKCTGCRTCVVACKDGNNLGKGMNFRTVYEYTGGSWRKDPEGAWVQDVFGYYVSDACNHCAEPACVKVCPTKAHFKNLSNGLVLIDADKCIGCGACAVACPYHAPVLDVNAGKMRKCDACSSRLKNQQGPLCVEACPQRALEFGPIDELRRIHGSFAEIAPLPLATTKPSLAIKVPKRGGKASGYGSGIVYPTNRMQNAS